MVVYLAGPIEGLEPGEARDWRAVVGADLAKFGIASFDPTGAFYGQSLDVAQQVADIDREVIAHSDLVLANLQQLGAKSPCFGTIREIEHARNVGKLVIVISREKLMSIFSHDVIQVETFTQAVDRIVRLAGGKQTRIPGT